MEIAHAIEETRTVPVAFAGQTGEVSYYKHRFTLKLATELQEISETEDVSRLAPLLATVIHSWDFTLNGQPIPANAEGLAAIPSELLSAVQEAISDQVRPSEEEKKGSSERSSTQPGTSTVDSPSSPDGSSTSPSPTVSASP